MCVLLTPIVSRKITIIAMVHDYKGEAIELELFQLYYYM